MNAPILYSERLELKPVSLKHLSERYVAWMNDPDVIRYLESGGDYTLDKLREFLRSVEKQNILFWAIHLKTSDKHIGNVKIDPINTRHQIGEYGIMMGDRTEWGKGYAQEASEAVIQYCFKEVGLRKITLGVVENNTSAVNLYERMGFETEGVFRQHGHYNGVLCNMFRMARFKENV